MTFTLEMWKEAVARGDTDSGFQEWAKHGEKRVKEEAERREKEAEYKLYRFSRYEEATIYAALSLWSQIVTGTGYPSANEIQQMIGDASRDTQGRKFNCLKGIEVLDLRDAILNGAKNPVCSGYLLTYPDGKVATITRKEPGDKCALVVKELFANEQTDQSPEA